MPVVGFNFDKTYAEKKAQVQKGMKAEHNITINSIDKEELNIGLNTKKIGLKFNFEYEVKYLPAIGDITIQGHILYTDEDKTVKEILSSWEKNKKIEPKLTTQLINTAIIKSTIKALSLAQDVNLPPHLPIPAISQKNQQNSKAKDYIG
jgi:hypothetical protein